MNPDAPQTHPPLVITLELEAITQEALEAERRKHFPPNLNQVPAHVSLFHALPGEHLQQIHQVLAHEANTLAPFRVELYKVEQLGRGVAYGIQSHELSDLHARLRKQFEPWLTPQDAQPFHPHVVIANKLDWPHAQALFHELSTRFSPDKFGHPHAVELRLWHYHGGPWTLAEAYSFPSLPPEEHR